MTESQSDTHRQFPEADNQQGLQRFFDERAQLLGLWGHKPGIYEFGQELPQIIGYVPQDEQERFDTLGLNELNGGKHKPGYEVTNGFSSDVTLEKLEELFPNMSALIADDLKRVGVQPTERSSVDLERMYIAAGSIPRGGQWHVDNPEFKSESPEPTFIDYLVSNCQATEIFKGDVRIALQSRREEIDPVTGEETSVWKVAKLDSDENYDTRVALAPDGEAVAPPDYAIVRTGPLCVHRSPIFTEDASRTFMRIRVYPDREPITS